ncbi:MAG: HD domain-containing phosphohydrolase [Anaerolineae bacterium]
MTSALPSDHDSGVRLAELMAALSMATDLGMGQPMEYAMMSCIVAVRLAEATGLSDDDMRDAYYEALLRYIGCNADTYWLASIVGDEIAFRTEIAPLDGADNMRVVNLVLRSIWQANVGADPARMAQAVAQGFAQMPQVRSSFFAGHCEVAKGLATRLGFPARFVATIGQIYARWDGKGVPALKGDAISPALLAASLAQDAVTFYRLGGIDAALAMARERRGGAHSPHLVDTLCRNAAQLFAGLDDEPVWDSVLAIEPGARRTLHEGEMDGACEAIADFVDIKSPFFLNHSRRVGDLAAATAQRYGLPDSDIRVLRRAALLHDIGKVGISAGIWGKRGPLTEREWDKVHLHPYYAERVLARPESLAKVGSLAAMHHERIDGSGYYRKLSGALLTPAARILAAANRYAALTEERPHRPPASPDEAANALQREVRAGRMDGDVVNALLAAAGHRVKAQYKAGVAGLSEREIEVLRLIARGYTMKQVAEALTISTKTVDRHIQNIYAKIGVSTRAGATLFAMENNLLA